ncbi:hypothetical protein GCM10023196_020160 [Actinoallomurus vinaceus]|uniref:Secreted protein n=1 Tax=Actinoallomurus vinaceus TaxID=1080074 RepID=A0ABP8U4J2_9ACTN
MDIGISSSFVLGVISFISAAVAVVSVVISHRQSREQARQTRVDADSLELNSAAFNLDVDGQFTEGLRQVLNHFVERPELRQYFTDGVSCSPDGPIAVRVGAIAEMLGDVLEVGLKISQRTMSADEQMIRSGYCRDVLETCPILTRLVAEHPRWWPAITALCDARSQVDQARS